MARINRELAYASQFDGGYIEFYIETEVTAVDAAHDYRSVDVRLIAVCETDVSLDFGAADTYLNVFSITERITDAFSLESGEHELLKCSLDVVSVQTSEESIPVVISFAHICDHAGIAEPIYISKRFPLGKLLTPIGLSLAQNDCILGDTIYFENAILDEGYGAGADIYVNNMLMGSASIDISDWSMQTDPEWAAGYPEDVRAKMKLIVYPYCKGQKVKYGTELEMTYTLYARDCMPLAVLTVTPESENEAIKAFGHPVKNRSGVKLSSGESIGRLGADIVSSQIVLDGVVHETEVLTTDILTEAGTHAWSLTVTDSRGLRDTANGTFEVYEYSPAAFTGEVYRCDASGSPDAKGSCISVTATSSDVFGYDGANENSLSYTFCKRQSGALPSEEALLTKSGTPAVIELGLEYDSSYDIKIICRDDFGGVSEKTFALDSERVELNIIKNGVAIGKYATKEKVFDCAWPMEVNGDITFTDENDNAVSLRNAILGSINNVRFRYTVVNNTEDYNQATTHDGEEGLCISVCYAPRPTDELNTGRYLFLLYKIGDVQGWSKITCD